MSNILDGLIMFLLFGILFVSFLVGVTMFENLTTGTSLVPASFKADGELFFTAFDNMGLFITLAIVAVTIGSAYLIKSNPIFFAIALILLAVQWLVLPPVINIINSIAVSPGMASGVSLFPKTLWLLGLSPVLSFIAGGIAAVVGLRGQ